MSERLSLPGALERQKMRALERYVAEGAERLVAAVSPERLTMIEAETVVSMPRFSTRIISPR
jgi:hypothetical protein